MMVLIIFSVILFAILAYFCAQKDGRSNEDIKDRLFHPREYASSGRAGERFLYRSLLEVGVSKEQIFRNVYIPALGKDGKENGKTTEIDILVVARKGVLVFEHKARTGNIYGDADREQWIQYLGKSKFFLQNPIQQNRYHKKCLERYIEGKAPIYTFITTSNNGKWKIQGDKPEDHIIRREGDFRKMYEKLPDCADMGKEYKGLLEKFHGKSRPKDGTAERHIRDFCL